MATKKTVKVTIHPSGGKGRPLSVQDAMNQILDVVDLLRAPKRARTDGVDYKWEIVSASTNSPMTIEIAPFGVGDFDAITAGAIGDAHAAQDGLARVTGGEGLPEWADSDALVAIRKISKRNMSGVGITELQISGDAGFIMDSHKAETALGQIKLFALPDLLEVGKHRARGDVSGEMTKAGTYYGRSAFWVRQPSGTEVVCTITDALIDLIGGERTLNDVWKHQYVTASGVKVFDATGKLMRLELDRPPTIKTRKSTHLDSVTDRGFTGGIPASDYLRTLRGDE